MKSGAAVGWIDASAVREHMEKIKCLSHLPPTRDWPLLFYYSSLPIRSCPSFKIFQPTGSRRADWSPSQLH